MSLMAGTRIPRPSRTAMLYWSPWLHNLALLCVLCLFHAHVCFSIQVDFPSPEYPTLASAIGAAVAAVEDDDATVVVAQGSYDGIGNVMLSFDRVRALRIRGESGEMPVFNCSSLLSSSLESSTQNVHFLHVGTASGLTRLTMENMHIIGCGVAFKVDVMPDASAFHMEMRRLLISDSLEGIRVRRRRGSGNPSLTNVTLAVDDLHCTTTRVCIQQQHSLGLLNTTVSNSIFADCGTAVSVRGQLSGVTGTLDFPGVVVANSSIQRCAVGVDANVPLAIRECTFAHHRFGVTWMSSSVDALSACVVAKSRFRGCDGGMDLLASTATTLLGNSSMRGVLNVSESEFRDGRCSAIVTSGVSVTLHATVFERYRAPTAVYGTCVHVDGPGDVTVTHTHMSECVGAMGSVALNGVSCAVLSEAVIESGWGINGGCVGVRSEREQSTIAAFSNISFRNCTSVESGGAVHLHNAELSVFNASFAVCTATSGGAIHATHTWPSTSLPAVTTTSVLRNCSFTNNTAVSNGGAVSTDAPIEVHACLFTSNLAAIGGSIFAQTGDAMKTDAPLPVALLVSSCSFIDSSVSAFGGAVYCVDDRSLNGTNGTEMNGPSFVLETSTFRGCRAGQSGGAVSVRGQSSATSAVIRACVFRNCSAHMFGGGIDVALAAVMSLENTTLDDCKARRGGAVHAVVGETSNSKALPQMALRNATVSACTATLTGGGVHVTMPLAHAGANVTSVALAGCVFLRNVAGDVGGGGALFVDGGARNLVEIADTVFEGNAVPGDYGASVASGPDSLLFVDIGSGSARRSPFARWAVVHPINRAISRALFATDDSHDTLSNKTDTEHGRQVKGTLVNLTEVSPGDRLPAVVMAPVDIFGQVMSVGDGVAVVDAVTTDGPCRLAQSASSTSIGGVVTMDFIAVVGPLSSRCTVEFRIRGSSTLPAAAASTFGAPIVSPRVTGRLSLSLDVTLAAACPPSSHYDPVALSCVHCEAGTFPSMSSNSGNCIACPSEGASCSGGSLVVEVGFAANGDDVLRCPNIPMGFFWNEGSLSCERHVRRWSLGAAVWDVYRPFGGEGRRCL
eukprot:Opistho-2@38473